jgi:diguanylate cyclase
MDAREPGSADGRHERLTSSTRPNRIGLAYGAYLVASTILILVYPWLPSAGRNGVFLLVSLSAIPAVLVGLRRISPGHRRTWVLLLAALAVINIANLLRLLPGVGVPVDNLLDAAGNVLVLAAALALITEQAHNGLGRIIDTTIAAFALGGVLWDVVLSPNLLPAYQDGAPKAALCIVIFALSGVLGALGQLVIQRPNPALRPLIVALSLGLVGNIVVAVTANPHANTAAAMMFIGAYSGVGLFGLHPTAPQLVTPAPMRPETLSIGRLVFLGLAVAVVPVMVGGRQLAGGNRDGLVLVISTVTIVTLVIVRIGQLSAQRNRAEQALKYEATHDSLTGLVNRKECLTRLRSALSSGASCAVLFCDLDRFKAVNDRYGHAHGDQLLIEVALRLRNSVRGKDVVCRFGGDEFVVLFRDSSRNQVDTIEQHIIDALSSPIPISSELITIGASTGTAFATGDIDPDELITRADHAMYVAKTSGTSRAA